jgi:hypothetical protein
MLFHGTKAPFIMLKKFKVVFVIFLLFLVSVILLFFIFLKMLLVSVNAQDYCSSYMGQQSQEGKKFGPAEVDKCINEYKSNYVLHF